MPLELSNIQFTYDEQGFELNIPKMQIKPGESVALVGPSGSGKTTLLNLIAGIISPDKGCIQLNDDNMTALNNHQRRLYRLRHIGMIFQAFELLDYLNVRDNILLQARLCPGVSIDQSIKDKASAIAVILGLGDKLSRNINALSQGERQRVAVCRALLLKPVLVLADEPTGNLDPENKQAVLEQLISVCKQQQCILLTVTHDHSLLPNFDRVINMVDLLISESPSGCSI